MKLSPDMFELVKNGRKTVELRLYDEKRKMVREGDTIIFRNTDKRSESVEVTVNAVNWFDCFETLYLHTDKVSMGYGTDDDADHRDMEKYYPPEKQYECGVVAIEITLNTENIILEERIRYNRSSLPK